MADDPQTAGWRISVFAVRICSMIDTAASGS
jgi:hypothetical protein